MAQSPTCLLHSLAKLINTLDEANAHIFFPVEHCLIHIRGPVAFKSQKVLLGLRV
jgi:hypothetical protein